MTDSNVTTIKPPIVALRRLAARQTLIEHFEQKSIPGPNGCWVWIDWTDRDGYGSFYMGRPTKAHRASWSIYRGPIPKSKWVLHHCDNPPCVNPDHLYLGDVQTNTADRVRRNRTVSPPGSGNGRAKLTESDIPKIRADTRTQRKIAADYGVAGRTICLIKLKRIWRHVDN